MAKKWQTLSWRKKKKKHSFFHKDLKKPKKTQAYHVVWEVFEKILGSFIKSFKDRHNWSFKGLYDPNNMFSMIDLKQ